MSNQIIPIGPNDVVPANVVFFVKVNYFYTPFFNPSRDTILGAAPQTGEVVLQIVDVQFDSMNNPTCKCVLTDAAGDGFSGQLIDSYIMNIFNYINAQITRLWGINITNLYFTTDDNYSDSNSTLTSSLGSGTTVNPNSTDLGTQSTQAASAVGDALASAKDAIANALPSVGIWVVVVLVVVVVGLFAFSRVERNAI